LDFGYWKVEGDSLIIRLLKFKPRLLTTFANLPNPDWILDFGYWKVEGDSLIIRLLKFKPRLLITFANLPQTLFEINPTLKRGVNFPSF